MPKKPIKEGIKGWAVAQRGILLAWEFHKPGCDTLGGEPFSRNQTQSTSEGTVQLAYTQQVVVFLVGNEHIKTFPIPGVAVAYNDEMNGVDVGDQLRADYGYEHSIRRGCWQALAWTFLLDVVLVNSFITQRDGQPA